MALTLLPEEILQPYDCSELVGKCGYPSVDRIAPITNLGEPDNIHTYHTGYVWAWFGPNDRGHWSIVNRYNYSELSQANGRIHPCPTFLQLMQWASTKYGTCCYIAEGTGSSVMYTAHAIQNASITDITPIKKLYLLIRESQEKLDQCQMQSNTQSVSESKPQTKPSTRLNVEP